MCRGPHASPPKLPVSQDAANPIKNPDWLMLSINIIGVKANQKPEYKN